MAVTRRDFLAGGAGALTLALAACNDAGGADEPASGSTDVPDVDLTEFEDLAIDMDRWSHDDVNDVYYQLGLPYCLDPASETYESLSIFVPGGFFTAEESGSHFSCEVNEKAVVGGFTAATAPVLLPVNTGDLSAQECPTLYAYSGLGSFLDAGCVYVYAGFRGRSAGYDSDGGRVYPGGSPWPVVDLKAAVRYLRYNAAVLPFDASRVFAFGLGAGGGLAAALGASGDAVDYGPYLEEIGAATHDAEGETLSDGIAGVAAWCPQTCQAVADAAYEWERGQLADADDRADGLWTQSLSRDLATAYGEWVNQAGLVSPSEGADLALDVTDSAVYAAGSYADELLAVLEAGATDFLTSTQFPYTYTPVSVTNPNFPGNPTTTAAAAAATDAEVSADETAAETETAETTVAGATQVQSTVFNTADDYVAWLNLGQDYAWITHDQTQGTVGISGLAQYYSVVVPATHGVGAYDACDRSTISNQLFGVEDEGTLHFSEMIADCVADNGDNYAAEDGWLAEYANAWSHDLRTQDSLGTSVALRVGLFDPLYYLSPSFRGYGTSEVAPHWRVNLGLEDEQVTLAATYDLYAALAANAAVSDAAFTAVWGKGHVLAETEGSPLSNLLAWVIASCS